MKREPGKSSRFTVHIQAQPPASRAQPQLLLLSTDARPVYPREILAQDLRLGLGSDLAVSRPHRHFPDSSPLLIPDTLP